MTHLFSLVSQSVTTPEKFTCTQTLSMVFHNIILCCKLPTCVGANEEGGVRPVAERGEFQRLLLPERQDRELSGQVSVTAAGQPQPQQNSPGVPVRALLAPLAHGSEREKVDFRATIRRRISIYQITIPS